MARSCQSIMRPLKQAMRLRGKVTRKVFTRAPSVARAQSDFRLSPALALSLQWPKSPTIQKSETFGQRPASKINCRAVKPKLDVTRSLHESCLRAVARR